MRKYLDQFPLPTVTRVLGATCTPPRRTRDDEEFLVATQDVVDDYIRRVKEEGSRLAQRQALIDVYTTRFGDPPASVVAIIARTTDPALLRTWLKLVANASAKDASAAIHAAAPPPPSTRPAGTLRRSSRAGPKTR